MSKIDDFIRILTKGSSRLSDNFGKFLASAVDSKSFDNLIRGSGDNSLVKFKDDLLEQAKKAGDEVSPTDVRFLESAGFTSALRGMRDSAQFMETAEAYLKTGAVLDSKTLSRLRATFPNVDDEIISSVQAAAKEHDKAIDKIAGVLAKEQGKQASDPAIMKQARAEYGKLNTGTAEDLSPNAKKALDDISAKKPEASAEDRLADLERKAKQAEERTSANEKRTEQAYNRGVSGTRKVMMTTTTALALGGLAVYAAAYADQKTGGHVSKTLGELSASGTPVISDVAGALVDFGPAAWEFLGDVKDSAAESVATMVIGALEEQNKIPEGQEGEDYRNSVRLSIHLMAGNFNKAIEIGTGAGLDIEDIQESWEYAKERQEQEGLSDSETRRIAMERYKEVTAGKAEAQGFGLTGSTKQHILDKLNAAKKSEEEDEAKKKTKPVTSLDEASKALKRSQNLKEARAAAAASLGVGVRLAEKLNNVSFDGMSNKIDPNSISYAFKLATENADKLGLNWFQKIGLKIASFLGSMFGAKVGGAIQRFAIDMLGVDEKIRNLKEGIAKATTVSTLDSQPFKDVLGDNTPDPTVTGGGPKMKVAA